MSNLAEKIEFTKDGKKVIIPKKLWQKIVSALENSGDLNVIEETKEKAFIEYVNERTKEAEKDRKKGKHFISLEELQKEYG